MHQEEADKKLKYWRIRIFWLVWINYASFYLIRANISTAIPDIISEFHITKTLMGSVLTVFFIVYAAGQFINGQLGDKFGGKRLLTIGLIASAIINIAFGFFAGNIILMLILWGLNGFFQSMGWSSSVKIIGNWFKHDKRAKRAGLLGTSYQAGNALSLLLAGLLISLLGWRWVFWIPAIFCLIISIIWLLKGSEFPEGKGIYALEEAENNKAEESRKPDEQYRGFRSNIKTVLSNRGIWIAAISMFFLDFIRTGFMFWAITYLFEESQASASIASFKIMMVPVAGSIGVVFTSWFAGRFLKKGIVRIIPPMILLLVVVCFIFLMIPGTSLIINLVLLFFIGFFLYGPHALMSAYIPIEYAAKSATASAAGFIGGWAYIGSALTSFLSGLIADNIGWNFVFYMWISGGIIAAVLMAFLWNYKPKDKKYYKNNVIKEEDEKSLGEYI